MGRKAVAPLVGEGMVSRRILVRAGDAVFVKGVVEASEGLAAVFAEEGGDLTIAAPVGREGELEALVREIVAAVGAMRRVE